MIKRESTEIRIKESHINFEWKRNKMEITSLSLSNEAIRHIAILVLIAFAIPVFTYFGLRKELRFVEQFLAVVTCFLVLEVFIFVMPFLLMSLKSLF